MVYVHLATGFEEVEASSITDILRRGGVEVRTVSVMPEQSVTGAHQMSFLADLMFEEADYDHCDMIVLPGGMPGTTNLQAHQKLCQNITRFAEQGKWIGAICAAPMILGSLGLLQGKKATIYPGMESFLTGAVPSREPVVQDGTIITSQAPGTAMLFGLELIRVLKGEKAMEEVRSELYMAM